MTESRLDDRTAAARIIDGPVKAVRVYEELAASMRARILSGELEDGYRLPSEKDLAAHAGVSRSTVREALRVLEQGGYVERLSPKVMVIRQGGDGPAFQEIDRALRWHRVAFNHLREALLLLEPTIAALAAARADPDDIAELESSLREAPGATMEHFILRDEGFHLCISEASGNPALVIARAPTVPLTAAVLHHVLEVPGTSGRLQQAQREIFDQVRAAEPDAAARSARARVDIIFDAWKRSGRDAHSRILGVA